METTLLIDGFDVTMREIKRKSTSIFGFIVAKNLLQSVLIEVLHAITEFTFVRMAVLKKMTWKGSEGSVNSPISVSQ